MSIKEQINEDLKTAMKARESHAVLTLRGLLSEVKRFEVDSRTDANDEKVISIIQQEIKKRRDALKFSEDAKRNDLIDQNQIEIKLLQKYLGEQLSEEKLREIISGIIAKGECNMGKIMGALNKDYKGKFEGRVASEIAKSLLG